MTRDEILAMEPTELSLAVAERIFQAKIIGNDRDPDARLLVGDFGKESWKPLKGSWSNADWRNSEEKAWLDCPKYGEDISAAWDVVSKFDRYEIGLWEGKVTASLGTPGYYASGETAPLAICRAALLAVMEDDKNV